MVYQVAKLYLTFCEPIDYSPPGSSVHGIFQAGILDGVAIPLSRGFSQPGIEPVSPALADVFFTTEPSGKPNSLPIRTQYITKGVKEYLCP